MSKSKKIEAIYSVLIALRKISPDTFKTNEECQAHIETKLRKILVSERKTLFSKTCIEAHLHLSKKTIDNTIEKNDLNLSNSGHKKLISRDAFIKYFAVPEIMKSITSKKVS